MSILPPEPQTCLGGVQVTLVGLGSFVLIFILLPLPTPEPLIVPRDLIKEYGSGLSTNLCKASIGVTIPWSLKLYWSVTVVSPLLTLIEACPKVVFKFQ